MYHWLVVICWLPKSIKSWVALASVIVDSWLIVCMQTHQLSTITLIKYIELQVCMQSIYFTFDSYYLVA